MFDFLLGKKKRVIDPIAINLLDDKYFEVELNVPFNIETLYNYLNYLRVNNITIVNQTPRSFYYDFVPYWVTDTDGYEYDYINMLDSILVDLEYFKEYGCIKLSHFSERLLQELDKLDLVFKYIRVKNK